MGEPFNPRRAQLVGPDQFERFRVSGAGEPLAGLGLDPDEELLVFERGGERRALRAKQMIYHHVAQGELAGLPYLVTF